MAIYSHLHLKVYLIDCGRVEAVAIPYVCGLTHFCAFGRAGRRTRRCRREESEAELQSQESLLRSCLKRCAIESSSSYEAVLRRLKKAMETNAPRPLNRNEMVIRLEQALRLDMECRQGQVRVRKLRSFEDLGIL
ncbi:unnamed protein product [Durusdinium trenchii]|uniref:Uncharacterized protein n=1 Tax=Durusdinium trenchii TaxID=1381693 RepID=A0ABP0MP98_9DINO